MCCCKEVDVVNSDFLTKFDCICNDYANMCNCKYLYMTITSNTVLVSDSVAVTLHTVQ